MVFSKSEMSPRIDASLHELFLDSRRLVDKARIRQDFEKIVLLGEKSCFLATKLLRRYNEG